MSYSPQDVCQDCGLFRSCLSLLRNCGKNTLWHDFDCPALIPARGRARMTP